MKFARFVGTVLCATFAPCFAVSPTVQKPASSTRSATFLTPKTSAYDQLLDPNRNRFAQSSLHDFSDLKTANRGFLTRRGAHFYWASGSRAKFWGINVANTTLQQSDQDIDAMLRNFRHAGFNLVRLHHFDERDGIIDLTKTDSRHFVESRLRKLDYWIFKARQNGLSVYLDLLDYRAFKAGDGVPNAERIGRAARPYNLFDPKLIELQKEYARKLLRDHVNFYTKLPYADDPTVVLLEIYDESGLFMRRNVWRQMPPPYAANFQNLWNRWLAKQYGTTEKLRQVWGNRVLEVGESLENGSVELPNLNPTPEKLPLTQQKWAQAARRNDGARFADAIHANFLRDMKSYLREIGVKIPISTVGRFDDIADLKSIAQTCDFTASNFYYDHPYWPAHKPAWKAPSFFHGRDTLSDTSEKSFTWSVAQSRVKNVPLVVREWNSCWPNESRAAGMIEAASYAALQDVDAMILFGYEITPTPRIFYFNVRSDLARWSLCGVASQIFLKNLVRPAHNEIVIPFNDVDVFSYNEYSNAFYLLANNARVVNDFYDGSYRADATTNLILPPGRSGIGRFENAPALLHSENLARDIYGREIGAPEYLSEYKLTTREANATNLLYDGILFDKNAVVCDNIAQALPLSLLRLQKREVVGADETNDVARGFIDRAQKRLVFGSLNDDEIVIAARQALRLFNPDIEYSKSNWRDVKVAVSDTNELKRDARHGTLTVDTPQFQAVCGKINAYQNVQLSALKMENARGVVVALSLDGLPLKTSRHWMLKLVTDARNRDQKIGRSGNQGKMNVAGTGPTQSAAPISSTRTRVWLNGKTVLEIGSVGAFELQFKNGKTRFWCDTPDVPLRNFSEMPAAKR